MNLYQNTSFNKNVSEPKALQSKYQDLLMSQIQPWNSNFFLLWEATSDFNGFQSTYHLK